MKIFVSAALIAAQTAAVAQPAFAAEIQRETHAATGTFAGFRLRVAMGGSRTERAPRLGLAFAPTVHSMNENGETRMRIGDGLEFGFSARRPTPSLSIAGRRLGSTQNDDHDRGGGISPIAWVAIGVGALAIGTVLLFESCRSGAICGSDRDD